MNNKKYNYFIYEAINNHFSILEKQLEKFKNIQKFDLYSKIIYKQIFHNKKIEIKVILNQYCKDDKLKNKMITAMVFLAEDTNGMVIHLNGFDNPKHADYFVKNLITLHIHLAKDPLYTSSHIYF